MYGYLFELKLKFSAFGNKRVRVIERSSLRPEILQYVQNSDCVQKPISRNGMLKI